MMTPKQDPAARRLSIALVLAALLVCLSGPGTAASDPDVLELLQKVDDMMRGDSSEARMTMRVKTARFERQLTMEAWSKGTEKTLIRILAPAKEKGTATLKVENKIWNYLPKVDRTIKVPASMMGASWMGSHFTNDDLVQNARYSRDFDCALANPTDETVWTIDCIPHETAAVVWGRVTIDVRKQDELPAASRFFDEREQLVRTMLFEEIRDFGGRRLPTRMRMMAEDKPGEFTEMVYEELQLDIDVPDRTFTLQALKQ